MTQRRRLAIVLGLNLALVVVLVVTGLRTRSLGLLAAGGDVVADSAALGLGLLATVVRDRVGERSRATTWVAGLNAVALLVLSVLVLAAGLRRLATGTPDVPGPPVLVVSSITALVMLAGVVVLGTGAGSEDLHMRSVLLDTAADALAAAAVAVGGLVITLTGRYQWLDSALAVGISVLVAVVAARLLRDVTRALRTGAALELDDD